MIRATSPESCSQRRYWSYSQLNQYLRCPLQYYFQRIAKLPQPTVGSGLVFGSAVHRGLAYIHQRMMDENAIDKKVLHREFTETWNDFEGIDVIYKANESHQNLIAKGITLLDLYIDQPVDAKIKGVEQRFLVPLKNSLGEYIETPMVAVVDLVTIQDGLYTVHEFKTSARQYSQMEVELAVQATCYANAFNEIHQQNPVVEYVILTKTKTPKVQKIQTVRNESDLQQLGDTVEAVDRAVRDNHFYPNRSPLNCSSCPYQEPCRSWTPEREIPRGVFN